jgi:hypothetical protein
MLVGITLSSVINLIYSKKLGLIHIKLKSSKIEQNV